MSTLASVSGMGLPLVVLAQILGSGVGGKIGAGKAKDYLKDLNLFPGTKFESDIKDYQEEVGADAFGKAIQEGLIRGVTMGVGDTAMKGLKGAGVSFKGLNKIIPSEIKIPKWLTPKLAAQGIQTNVEIPMGPRVRDVLAKVTGGKGIPQLADVPLSKLKDSGLKQFLMGEAAKAPPKTLGRIISSAYGTSKIKEKPSIYDYELPQSMATPRSEDFPFLNSNLFGGV